MNENVKKWVAALRSGKYKQGTCALNKNGKFCCLGVACEVAIENGLKVAKETIDILDGKVNICYNGYAGVLPLIVQSWLGLNSCTGKYYKIEGGARYSRIVGHLAQEFWFKSILIMMLDDRCGHI